MDALRYGREIRWLFQVGMLIFLVTVGLGAAAGMQFIDFTESQSLTHLHAGVIGWITLGVMAAGLWLYGGTAGRRGDERWVPWAAIVLIISVPLFVLAWWLDSPALLAPAGSLVLLGIVMYVGWLLREAARIGYRNLTTPQLGVAVGIVTLVVGSAIGVLIAGQMAGGTYELPVMIHFVHAETQISGYLLVAAMALAYWRLHGNDRTAAGTWMVWLLFAAGVIIAGSLLANSVEGTIAFVPLDLAAFAIFLRLAWRKVLAPGWLQRDSLRHYAVAIPFALFYLAIFIYLVLGLTLLGLWADPSQIPENLIPASSHPLFVGTATMTLFGLLFDLNRDKRSIWPWADHLVFWGITLAVAAFTLAILVEADEAFRVITPILGASILVGVVVHSVRLWSRAEVGVAGEVPSPA